MVGKLFDDLTTKATPEESQQVFLRLREAITCVFPFLGMPSCVPGCYGMIGVVERKGSEYASQKRIRELTVGEKCVEKGKELRKRIYTGVGNSSIMELLQKYFTDLYSASTVFTWGYLVSAATEEVFEVHEAHLIVATAITALGATRQTHSHLKATIGIGNKVEIVRTVVEVVVKVTEWAGRPIVSPNIEALADELRENLAKA